MSSQLRKPTNLSMDATLLTEAKALNVNLFRAAEEGIRHAVATAKAEQWKTENASALRSSNNYVEKHGLALDEYLQF